MRVAYVVTRADDLGGAQIHVRDFAARLLRDGHEAVVFAGASGMLRDQLRELRVPFVEIPELARDPDVMRDLSAYARLRAALRAYRPQLVSAHCAKAGFVARVAARSLSLPAIYTAHGWAFADGVPRRQELIARLLERVAAPLARRIIVVSDYDRRIALRFGVAGADRLRVIHNGMPDVSAPLMARPDHSDGRIVMIGRFSAQKDHATLLRALARVARPWHLDLIGDGPYQRCARQLASELGIANRVSFLGWRTDVAELLSRAQLFALISHWEGFPRSILEAMRAGLPVVASDVGGVRESVEEGATGLLVPREDVNRLAESVTAVLDSLELRTLLGKQARLRYENEFTFERMFDSTLKVYREVIESAPSQVGALELARAETP